MVCDAGVRATLKSGGIVAVTVSEALAEGVVVDVPVTVKLVAAAGAEVGTVNVELLPATTLAGENDPDAPAGRPETESAIACVLLFTAAVVTVYVVLLPATTERLAGVTSRGKTGGPRVGMITGG